MSNQNVALVAPSSLQPVSGGPHGPARSGARKWKIGLAGGIVACGLLALFAGTFGSGTDVMPLDDATLENYKVASEKAAIRLSEEVRTLPPAVANAMVFRKAVGDLGFDPDRTLLRWMAPDFEKELHQTCDTQAELAAKAMGARVLLLQAMGLGYGFSHEDVAKAIALYSPEVQAAAAAVQADEERKFPPKGIQP